MPSYRLKPRLPIWKIAGVMAALMLAPVLVSLVLPQLADDRSTVTLGMPGMDWEEPIHWPDGGDLICEEVGDVMFPVWDCDGTRIHTLLMEDSRNAENTLQRAMRATLAVPLSEGEFVQDGNVLLYETDEGVGISKEVDGQTIVAVVEGAKQRPYAAIVLYELRDQQGELPDLSELGVTA